MPAEFGDVLASWRASWIAGDESAPPAHGLTHAAAIQGTLYLQERGLTFTASRAEDLLRGELTGTGFSAISLEGLGVVPPGAGPDGQPREASGIRSQFPRLVVDATFGSYLFEALQAKDIADQIAAALRVKVVNS